MFQGREGLTEEIKKYFCDFILKVFYIMLDFWLRRRLQIQELHIF